jgi:hypothetical protein
MPIVRTLRDEIQSRERYRFYMVVPLLNFWFSLSTPTEHIQILFPFFFRFREVLRHRVFVFPWFYYSHDLRNLDRRLVLSPFIVDDDCVQRYAHNCLIVCVRGVCVCVARGA